MMIRAPLFTLSTCIDVMLVYEKIQIYTKEKNFFTKKSANVIALVLFIYSIMLNVPVSISRDTRVIELEAISNVTIELKAYKVRSFQNYQNIFLASVFLFNFFRDVGQIILIIGINIRLIMVISKYNKKISSIISNEKQTLIKKRLKNDCKNVFIKSTYSGLLNFLIYCYSINNLYGKNYLFNIVVYTLCGLLSSIRSSINFLVMLKYNKIFRENFSSYFKKAN